MARNPEKPIHPLPRSLVSEDHHARLFDEQPTYRLRVEVPDERKFFYRIAILLAEVGFQSSLRKRAGWFGALPSANA
jgi:hypothetical protein